MIEELLANASSAVKECEVFLEARGHCVLTRQKGLTVGLRDLRWRAAHPEPLTRSQRITESQELLGLHDGLMAYQLGIKREAFQAWKVGDPLPAGEADAIAGCLEAVLGVPRAWVEAGALPMLVAGTPEATPGLQALREQAHHERMERIQADHASTNSEFIVAQQARALRPVL